MNLSFPPIPAAVLSLAFALGAAVARAEVKTIDLGTKEGVEAVGAEWRWHDVRVEPIEVSLPDGSTTTAYSIEPKAQGRDYDDSDWEVIDPTSLGERRSGGKVCFCWYRIRVTLPEGVEGKTVEFVTTVDDYGEVWVDGELNYSVGTSGGSVVAGFNVPNRVALHDPQPRKSYQIAVFGINGPISAEPDNRIFLRGAKLEIQDQE